MSRYRVRVGDRIIDVEGLPGLIGLVRSGELKAEDPVFIPTTGKWHYARSVRQLRDHFPVSDPAPIQAEPQAPAPPSSAPGSPPPPPPSRNPRAPASARPPASSLTPGRSSGPPSPPREAGAPPTTSPDPEDPREADDTAPPTGLAEVVPFRRGRWTPAGKGLEVPVFAYEVDLDAGASGKAFRLGILVLAGLVLIAGTYVYVDGYGRYQASFLDKVEDGQPVWAGANEGQRQQPGSAPGGEEPPPDAAPEAATTAVSGVKAADPSAKRKPATATPQATARVASFDVPAALAKVRGARVTPVRRPEELGPAVRADLLRIAVPLRDARFVSDPSARKNTRVAPFLGVLEWTAREDRASASRQRLMVVAMAGRRIDELGMNVSALALRTVDARGRKTETRIPADLAVRLARGEADLDELERQFASR